MTTQDKTHTVDDNWICTKCGQVVSSNLYHICHIQPAQELQSIQPVDWETITNLLERIATALEKIAEPESYRR